MQEPEASDKAATNASRAARFISKATEQAAQALLSAANGTNSLPDIHWDSFPAAVRLQLRNVFQQQGWVTVLGIPVLQQQLPYEHRMGLNQYHSFIANNPYFIGYWDEDYWVDDITPTPAQYPWLHPRQLQDSLSEDQILSLSAQLPAFRAVLEAAVAASILPEQLLQQARAAAATAPLRTVELFIRPWVKQAAAAVSATSASILSSARLAPPAANKPPTSSASAQMFRSLRLPPLGTFRLGTGAADGLPYVISNAEDRGSGSGGRCYGSITAVGSGDEGSGSGRRASVMLYGDAQQPAEADVAGGAQGPPDTDSLSSWQE
jgi:hypothetical protein